MTAKTVNVYRIDYERGNRIITTFIAGHTADDVTEYMRESLGNVRVTQQGFQCRLDRFTEPVAEMVYNNLHQIYGTKAEIEKQKLPNKNEPDTQNKTEIKKAPPKIKK